MSELPLHPAIVHIPLVLTLVIPLAAGALAWALWRDRLPSSTLPSLPSSTWVGVVVLQAIVVGAAFLALRTGGQEEERVEDRVAEATIEAHEELAEAFTWTAGAVLLLAAAAYAVRSGPGKRALMAATVAGSLATLAIGLQVGHAGGHIVYGPGGLSAGSAEATSEPGAPSLPEPGERGEHGERDDD